MCRRIWAPLDYSAFDPVSAGGYLLDERAGFFLALLDERVGLFLAPSGCRMAVYFFMKSLASPSVLIARLSSSMSFFTTAARCSTCIHRSSETGRCLL